MNDINKNSGSIRLKTLTFNTFYNLLGYGIPLLLALAVIPVLLNKLGTDKFGVLNLAWIVIGYFGFFDLGIGRALTKIVSEKIGLNQNQEIPTFFWTSIFLMILFSSIVSLLLFLFSDKLIFSFFKIPVYIQTETIKAFYILILAIPIVTTTAAFRGMLEAYQRFDIINVIRILLGISSFLVPLIVVLFANDLFWIVFFLVIIRILIWMLYLISALKLNPDLVLSFKVDLGLIGTIFKLSSWMTLSNITVPIIVYIDRILIASLVSAAAVAYYSTPYEMITKILIVPSALTAVLFPTFAANYLKNPSSVINLSEKSMKYIGLLLFPVIAIVIIYSKELLIIWLGNEFAMNSYLILQFIAAGILFNSIAYIPFSFIEGIGRPDITAKLQLIELPFYLILMWLSIKSWGIYGAAFIYMLRMLIDCFLMVYFSRKIIGEKLNLKLNSKIIYMLLIILLLYLNLLVSEFVLKATLTFVLLMFFVFVSLKYFLDEEDKLFIKSRLQPIFNK